ncbi:hypothetical protein [Nocardia sp. AG03]|uniref:hypothetical protein n=1 Tax=Nocardia sp. AG03 TaxID=3025312 RepID=UPI00241856B5|nr:hypothetical protein [Nocardia sp. AG03]
MPAQKSEAIRSVAIAAAAVHSTGAQARDLLHAAAANTHEQACRLRRAADAEHLRATTAAATAATLRIRTHATTAANAATELLDRGYLALEVLHFESGPTVPVVMPGHADPAGGVIALLLNRVHDEAMGRHLAFRCFDPTRTANYPPPTDAPILDARPHDYDSYLLALKGIAAELRRLDELIVDADRRWQTTDAAIARYVLESETRHRVHTALLVHQEAVAASLLARVDPTHRHDSPTPATPSPMLTMEGLIATHELAVHQLRRSVRAYLDAHRE